MPASGNLWACARRCCRRPPPGVREHVGGARRPHAEVQVFHEDPGRHCVLYGRGDVPQLGGGRTVVSFDWGVALPRKGTTGALQLRCASGGVGGDWCPLVGALSAVPEDDESPVAPPVLRIPVRGVGEHGEKVETAPEARGGRERQGEVDRRHQVVAQAEEHVEAEPREACLVDELVARFVTETEGGDAVAFQPVDGDLEEAAGLGRVIFDGIRAGSIWKVFLRNVE